LKDDARSTGFMEMSARFVPTESRVAEHLVHSISSHQQAIAQQEYVKGYAHGHADGASVTAAADDEDEEPAFVEADAEAETESESEQPTYIASDGSSYYGTYPPHAVSLQPFYGGGTPAPPQYPAYLPPPPYVTPVAPAAAA